MYKYKYDISLQDQIDPEEACQGPRGNITQYQISFQNRSSVIDTEKVNITRCTAGRCSHTFQLPSNPPSSYDSVSVAAENVVGVGAARTCTSQSTSELNFIILTTNLYIRVMHNAHMMHLAAWLCKVINYSNLCCTIAIVVLRQLTVKRANLCCNREF